MAAPKKKNEQVKQASMKSAGENDGQAPAVNEQAQSDTKNILIGESGDILARYRIPIENNHVDYALQLPEDSDSSNFSSDENEDGEPKNQDDEGASGNHGGNKDAKEEQKDN